MPGDPLHPAPRRGIRSLVCGLAAAIALSALSAVAPPPLSASHAQPGLPTATTVARAYDLILDADFDAVPGALAATCPPAPEVACLGLTALATWWAIQLDPQDRSRDDRFLREVDAAVQTAEAWTTREPKRAEAWLYLGAAHGVRGQWKILRGERLAAAREGKRIKEVLDEALAIDPAMADASFGVGVYRYYADVAPAIFRWTRWLLLLPGGNREEGLAQMERARRDGIIVREEAAWQLHLAYLWYERRFDDALALVRELKARHPRNPLFAHREAEILSLYFKDAAGSLAASEALLARAEAGDVRHAGMASVRARLNIAVQLEMLGQRDRARATLDALLASQPTAPVDAVRRAGELQRAWRP